jgi:hypothetical protein
MDRRDFLKLTSLAGFTLAGTGAMAAMNAKNPRRGPMRPRLEPYTGPYFIMVNASGGWDPTSLCDPKGRANDMEEDPMNMYFTDDIGSAGPFSYAPLDDGNGYSLADFFDKHHSRLSVINGIDMQTNGHDSGSRHTWSGRLAEGFPSLAALIAANHGRDLPMSYLSFGGYDFTDGIVARTRSGNVGALERIAYPERMDTSDETSLYHSDRAAELIQEAHAWREQHLLNRERLPKVQHTMNLLFGARVGADELKKLTQFLPDPLDNSGNAIFRQAQVALAAYRAGISISVNINVGGFDTHGNHDAAHIPRIVALMQGIDFIWEEAGRQDVQDKVVIVVGSDFGRTPGYNEGQGKDHWSVTSMMAMGAGIAGGNLVGETTDRHGPLEVDPNSFTASSSGVRIKPEHIHQELRRLGGVDDVDLASMYPLFPDERLKVFG